MHLGNQFKEYREEYMGLRQFEAAAALKISPATLSNYERNKRGFPSELLPIVKKTFNIPDDYFLALVLGTPLKNVRDIEANQPSKAREIKMGYMDSFIDHHRQLFEDSPELREFVSLLESLSPKDRRDYLNAHKKFLTLLKAHMQQAD